MAGGAKEGDAARPLFVYEAVRLFIIWCEQEWGIPRTFPADLISDKAGTPGGSECYGYNSPCRMTTDQWLNYTGWYSHAMAPENTHWNTNISLGMWHALMGDIPIIAPPTPPPTLEDDMLLPLLYGDGFKEPPDDSVYAGQDRSHRREDVKYMQLIAGSGVDGYYGPNTALDFATTLGSGDGRSIGYAEYDQFMDKQYGDNVLPDHTHGGIEQNAPNP
jgi:hypothetical protein